MDKAFIPTQHEKILTAFWHEKGYFTARVNKQKKPFCIILPPPNANADLHLGHAMYVYEDIMVRFHKLQGYEVLWVPGADHAGFETQFVFEKHLKKQDKSRFDYSRDELFSMIWKFVMENRGNMEEQLKRLGFALDWNKSQFTLDEKIVKTVHKTFKALYEDKLIYRSKRLVNYCTRCGTGFSDLEVKHVEQNDPLYYLKYGPFVLATVRPETKFGDTAIAVHPKDKRYKKWVGNTITFEGLIGPVSIKVIADESVDPNFGTGVVKITPAHDFNDFETGKRHGLEVKQVIGFDGRLMENTGPYAGLKIKAARQRVVEDLQAKGLIDHIDENYVHAVGTCYKCGSVLEPLPISQWYIKVQPLAQKAIAAIKGKKTVVIPKKYEKRALQWLTDFHDWNISRQIVWGMRIPAWKCASCKSWTITDGDKPAECSDCKNDELTQDTDTFDTWFSSGQWPVATLHALGEDYFSFFYPTSVMETGYDILPWWVCRMMMLGLYMTGKTPFHTVYLHGLIRDAKGAKMSKSKGNVVNPMVMIDKYGADALRASLVFQASAGNDISFAENKVVGMRNFTNKIWNIGRFLHMYKDQNNAQKNSSKNSTVIKLEKESEKLKKNYFKGMSKYQFSTVFGELYEFLWHRFADFYIEQLKQEVVSGNMVAYHRLFQTYKECLVMLHPFMPFVTEAAWKSFEGHNCSILDKNNIQ